jgi:hypothetical protein
MKHAIMVRDCPDQSSASRGYFLVWFIASASCLFTALIITSSLRQGRLSLPATYDDVVYFNDAASRLQILYDNGFVPFLIDLFHQPPHSPFATLVPLLGFALFGMHDWAPATVNAVWVALLLLFINLLLPKVPRWAYVTVALSTLAWPVTAAMVVECRPDIYAALLTVMGAMLMLRAPFVHATVRHIALVAVLFGAALLAKPSISPITILLYCGSLAVTVMIEGRGSYDRKFLGKAALRASQCLAITIAVAMLYFTFAWRDLYDYIYTVMLGSQSEIWRSSAISGSTQLSAFETAGYYLWGLAGQNTMGIWLWITIFLVAINVMLGPRARWPINSRTIGLIIIFILAYVLVTIPPTKSPDLGVVVSVFVMAFYVLACGGIIASFTPGKTYGRWIAVGFCAALCITSLVVFHWAAWSPLDTSSHLMAARRQAIIRELGDYLESEAVAQTKEIIFFPVSTQFLNMSTLQFELQKRRLENVETVWNIFSPDGQRGALDYADYVILFDEDDPDILRFLPDAALYSQTRRLVIANPFFKEKLELTTADGFHKIRVYARKNSHNRAPFHNLGPISGFLPIEGPYPQWKLPLVRWATGPAARAEFLVDWRGKGHLVMRARSDLAGQRIDVMLDGEPAGTCDLATPGEFVECSFPVNVSRSLSVVDLSFSKSGSVEDGGRSVLFTELRLNDED